MISIIFAMEETLQADGVSSLALGFSKDKFENRALTLFAAAKGIDKRVGAWEFFYFIGAPE